MPNEKKLEGGLSNRHVQMMALGGAIGTGLFLGSGKSISLAGSSIILAYTLTGIMIFFIMRALGELILSDSKHSSFIGFIREYFGKRWAFVTSWTYWFCWASLAMADLTAVGIYVQYWFPHIPQWVPGLIALFILLILNLTTVKLFGEIEFWFALIKIVAIIALIAIGAYLLMVGTTTSYGTVKLSNLWQAGGVLPNGWFGFILSFQMVVFAFAGVEMVGLTLAEIAKPSEVVPKAINNIPIRILLFYIGSLIIIMSIFPWEAINPTSSPFVTVFSVVGIVGAAGIINFVVLTSAASAANSGMYSTSRLVYHMARRDDAPEYFNQINKRKIPSHALYFSTIIIFLTVFLNYFMPEGVFTMITTISTSCFLFIWGIIVVCHMQYRKKAALEKKELFFKMPLFPLTSYLVLAFLIFVVVVLFLAQDTRQAIIVTPIWFLLLFIAYAIKEKFSSTKA